MYKTQLILKAFQDPSKYLTTTTNKHNKQNQQCQSDFRYFLKHIIFKCELHNQC